MNKDTITIQISVGELLDRVSILYIKNSKIKYKEELKEIEKELLRLLPITSPFLENPEIDDLYTDLMGVNFDIWNLQESLFKHDKEHLTKNIITALFKRKEVRKSLINQINKLTWKL